MNTLVKIVGTTGAVLLGLTIGLSMVGGWFAFLFMLYLGFSNG